MTGHFYAPGPEEDGKVQQAFNTPTDRRCKKMRKQKKNHRYFLEDSLLSDDKNQAKISENVKKGDNPYFFHAFEILRSEWLQPKK